MLTPEMLKILGANSAQLRYPIGVIEETLQLMPGGATTDGSEYREGTHPQMARGMQRNLTGIICGTEFAIGDRVRISPAAHANKSSCASLLPVGSSGTVTCIRWPNSENCGVLVIQADFEGVNYHFNARDLQRV